MQIKNKFFFILLNIFSIIFLNINVNAEEFNISAQEITIDKVNNIVIGIGEVEAKDSGGKTIKANKIISKGEQYFYPLFAHDENVISPRDSLVANEIIYSIVHNGGIVKNVIS